MEFKRRGTVLSFVSFDVNERMALRLYDNNLCDIFTHLLEYNANMKGINFIQYSNFNTKLFQSRMNTMPHAPQNYLNEGLVQCHNYNELCIVLYCNETRVANFTYCSVELYSNMLLCYVH